MAARGSGPASRHDPRTRHRYHWRRSWSARSTGSLNSPNNTAPRSDPNPTAPVGTGQMGDRSPNMSPTDASPPPAILREEQRAADMGSGQHPARSTERRPTDATPPRASPVDAPARGDRRTRRHRQDPHHRHRRRSTPSPGTSGRWARAVGQSSRRTRPEAGCPTDTARRVPHPPPPQHTPWPPGTTVILDEAGMTATADLARLVALVREHQWRLVAVGDPEQLPSVARGGVFAHWCDTIPHHTLDTPRRFTETMGSSSQPRPPHRRPRRRPDLRRARSAPRPPTLRLSPPRSHELHHNHTAAGRSVAITTNTVVVAAGDLADPLETRGFGAPGGTRIPNLLIRSRRRQFC